MAAGNSDFGPSPEVAIIGGGIIGCSLAYELARNGVSVTVIERGVVGREASGASAGIISPPSSTDTPRAKAELTAAGFRLDGEGNLLRNPADNKAASNSETGHFASDRFMLRMKRP